MRVHFLRFGFAFSLAALGLGTAYDARGAGDSWCDDPVANICQGSKAGQERELGFLRNYRDAVLEARKKTEKKFGLADGFFSKTNPDDVIDLLRVPYERHIDLYTVESLSRTAKRWEDYLITANIPTVHGLLVEAIDREVKAFRLDPLNAAYMKRDLGAVNFISASAVFEAVASDSKLEAELEALIKEVDSTSYWTRSYSDLSLGAALAYKIFKNCGKEGTGDQAFLLPHKGKQYAIFCPGLVIRSMESSRNEYEGFESVLWVVAHELSHSFDSRSRDALYSRMQACVSQEYGNDLYLSYNNKGLPTHAPVKAALHISEMSADFWAARTVDVYISRLKTVAQRRDATRLAWRDLCNVDMDPVFHDAGTHPAPPVRFLNATGRSPESRELLGCSRLAQPRSCGLSGAR